MRSSIDAKVTVAVGEANIRSRSRSDAARSANGDWADMVTSHLTFDSGRLDVHDRSSIRRVGYLEDGFTDRAVYEFNAVPCRRGEEPVTRRLLHPAHAKHEAIGMFDAQVLMHEAHIEDPSTNAPTSHEQCVQPALVGLRLPRRFRHHLLEREPERPTLSPREHPA
jgi:hypothetical protein